VSGQTPPNEDELLPVCRVGELDEPDENTRWLVDTLWGRSAVGFLAGRPKLGKAWLGLDLALSVATATPCLGRFHVRDPGDVLVYLAEDHPASLRERLAGLCLHRGLALDDVPLHVITAPALRLDLECDQLRLHRTAGRIRPRLILLDPLVRLHRRDENHAGDVAELLAFLRHLQRHHDLAVLVVHHMRKSGAAHAGQALRGSGDFHAWTDSALYLRSHHDRLLLSPEHRDAPAPNPIELRLCSRPDGSQTHLEILDPQNLDPPVPPLAPSLTDRLLDLLHSVSRPLTRMELRQRLRVNNQRLGQLLADLDQRQVVARSQQGWSLVGPGNALQQ